MRHGKKVNHLSRKTAHRKAMLANMACSLITHKRINTTVAKAKALRVFVEPIITKAKSENNKTISEGTHNRRIAFKYLRDKYAVTELFGVVSEKVADRPGGYTRIIKLGNRLGDNADMAMIELVDFNELYNQTDQKSAKKKSTRRSRRKSSQGTPPVAVEEASEEVVSSSEEATVFNNEEDKVAKKEEEETTAKENEIKSKEDKEEDDATKATGS